jgi:hypothetical protein
MRLFGVLLETPCRFHEVVIKLLKGFAAFPFSLCQKEVTNLPFLVKLSFVV